MAQTTGSTPDESPNLKTQSPLLTPEQAGDYLRLHHRTLANLRCLGRGPRYVRSGRRAFYRRCDLDAWIDCRVYDHTSAERTHHNEQLHGVERPNRGVR